VWLNLLLNARDAIEEAEREGWVRVTSLRRKEWVVVRFADNGVGIPSHMLNRIYDPFFTTKPPGKGTGLGLFTCYRTVVRHKGEINVSSQVGEGTSIDISLPIWQEREPDQ
jgi:signal transduction histidine kinase